MYTQFLSEQIKDCEDKVEGSTAPAAAVPTKAALPAKGAKKGPAKGGKRARNGAAKEVDAPTPDVPELTPTQVRRERSQIPRMASLCFL